jgi:hypothetical protein
VLDFAHLCKLSGNYRRIILPEKYYYRAYGLNIEAEIQCPELMDARTDESTNHLAHGNVYICYGKVPDQLENATVAGEFFQAKPDHLLFHIDGLASFYISNGERILIEPDPGASEEHIRLYLLGSSFGALLHQLGFLVIHGSAIATERGAVLFVGESGHGKSTTATAFCRRGYSLISDDVCTLALDDQLVPIVYPSYPQVNLWDVSLQKLGETTAPLRQLRPDMEKFALGVREAFHPLPSTLFHIYELQTNENMSFELHALEGADKFGVMLDNTYRAFFMDGLETLPKHFELAAEIARKTGVSRLTSPRKKFLLDETLDLLEEDFAKQQ